MAAIQLTPRIHSYYRRSLQLAYFCDGEDIEFPAAADSPYCPNLLSLGKRTGSHFPSDAKQLVFVILKFVGRSLVTETQTCMFENASNMQTIFKHLGASAGKPGWGRVSMIFDDQSLGSIWGMTDWKELQYIPHQFGSIFLDCFLGFNIININQLWCRANLNIFELYLYSVLLNFCFIVLHGSLWNKMLGAKPFSWFYWHLAKTTSVVKLFRAGFQSWTPVWQQKGNRKRFIYTGELRIATSNDDHTYPTSVIQDWVFYDFC